LKKLILLLAVILTLTMAACTAKNTTETNAAVSGTPTIVASEPTSESTQTTEPAETENNTVSEPAAAADNTSSQAPTKNATTSAAPNNPAAGKSSSKPTNPPAENSQAPVQPKGSDPPAQSTPPPATSAPPKQSEPTVPVYTQKDYDDIIKAVRDYAESQTKVKFTWDSTMQKDGHAYHGTPSLTQKGKDGVISALKYHVDLTVDVVTNPAYGVPSSTVSYNIIWYEKNGEILFVLIYG